MRSVKYLRTIIVPFAEDIGVPDSLCNINTVFDEVFDNHKNHSSVLIFTLHENANEFKFHTVTPQLVYIC